MTAPAPPMYRSGLVRCAGMPISFRSRVFRGASAPDGHAEPCRPGTPGRTSADTRQIQRLIDATDALVVVLSADCHLWLWNRRCDETSGVPLAEAAGKPLWSVMRLRQSQRVMVQGALDRLLAGDEHRVELRSRWPRKDGRQARISWSARLVDWGEGLRFVVATGSELARGQRTAREIAETESRFETLLEVLPDPVLVHRNGRVVFANRAALEMYGAGTVEEMYGPIIDLAAPEYRAFVQARMARMLGAGETVPMAQERHVRLDGTVFDVEVVAAPVTFDGRPAIEVVARDITVRIQTEAALRASEARVRAVFDQSSLGMILVDVNGRALESNPAFRRLLGYDAVDLAGLAIADYTHPDDVESGRKLLADLFAERNEGYELEKRYMAKDDHEIWARVHVSPVRDGWGPPKYAVATIEDITEHNALEDQLRQASKMEALGRLASGVAHDFNNLLTVVNGYAELLVDSLQGDDRAADAVEIRKAGLRATELTAQLLAFGRRSKRELEPVDLNGRIEAMVPMLRRVLGEDIEFTASLDRGLGTVMADPSQLDQVVMNLAVNARDAMPAGGSLSLATSRLTPGGSSGREGADAWARLEIADSGTGMEPDVLEHIFEPFYTTKGKGKGTGLGLAVVYGIVQQMNGSIRVESTVGVGSRCIVELPLCDVPSARPGGIEPVTEEPVRATETVLVVEDEATVRDLCKRALEAEGYRVYVAGPHEALALADRIGRALDILVTDVVMPEFDGPTIAAALRSGRQDLKVLFMSGYPRDREEELTGAVAEGFALSKPFTPRELGEAVRRVLGKPPADE
jgi:two-component system, cell cycle sensor histidine kinase and response regulator CckA